jgi:hypothetical protein
VTGKTDETLFRKSNESETGVFAMIGKVKLMDSVISKNKKKTAEIGI